MLLQILHIKQHYEASNDQGGGGGGGLRASSLVLYQNRIFMHHHAPLHMGEHKYYSCFCPCPAAARKTVWLISELFSLFSNVYYYSANASPQKTQKILNLP